MVKRLIYLFLGATSFFCQAMQQNPKLLILNQFPKKIEVKFQYDNQAPITHVISKDEEFPVLHLNALSSLTIQPYGEVRQWVSAEKLTLGYVPSVNFAVLAQEESKKLGNQDVQLIIRPGGEYLSWVIGQKAAQEITPYLHAFAQAAPESTEQKFFLIDEFPQAREAANQEKTIEPRYILGVGAQANDDDKRIAYQALLTRLTPRLNQGTAEDRRYAQDALTVVHAAYKASIGQESLSDFHKTVDPLLSLDNIYHFS